ncbi:pseudouridine synthase [Marinirhabdus gelatinilytica]|uniref:Pseudouridine synthase n=2 Tax=Marinirhabdus gelatinilytica TaxID=1703343 RepID=A0A370QA56_9FLAO|nr:pseudouridine synthase [Marinirhabdus gelatinilytica]
MILQLPDTLEVLYFYNCMSKEQHSYFKLYKPYKYLSQFITNDTKAKRKRFLGELYPFPEGTMAVGRLDETSEGLLFLTTNGKFSYHITNTGVEKEYYAQVDGLITVEAILKLQKGVSIGVKGKDYITKPCQAKIIEMPNLPPTNQRIRDDRHGPTSWVSITITEGKFRQIRKMTAAVGFPTLRLVRVRIGSETIESMQPGDVVGIKHTMDNI